MKRLFAICTLLLAFHGLSAQQKLHPEIDPYGEMSSVPGVQIKADEKLHYKIVAEIKSSDTLSAEVNQSLDVVARMVNMLSYDGIKKDKRSIEVIVHNMGAYLVQNDAAYQRKYGHANPNTDLIRQLTDAGVHFVVCGQSSVRRKIAPDDLLPGVKIATSFLTEFTTLQLKGYATLNL